MNQARKPMTRRQKLIAALVVAFIGMGCNPILAPFQLIGLFNNPKGPSQFNFYDRACEAKKKKDISVLVLAYSGQRLPADYAGTDRILATKFVKKLDETFKMNKERVVIVSLAEVEKFKRRNDDWKAMTAAEIGKKFKVDYVIDLELRQLSLFEPGTREILHGHCHIPIQIIDVEKGDDPFEQYEYDVEYPGVGQSVPVDMESNPEKFKQKFFDKMAIELTKLFTPVSTADGRMQ
jgi:hypothetical protein